MIWGKLKVQQRFDGNPKNESENSEYPKSKTTTSKLEGQRKDDEFQFSEKSRAILQTDLCTVEILWAEGSSGITRSASTTN